jgi:hypothetical protein
VRRRARAWFNASPMPTGGRLLFDAAIQPRWAFVSPLRKFVAALLENTCPDADHVSRVAMTTHELLENAVKYGLGTVKVVLELDDHGFARSIEVGTTTTPERRADAAGRIDALNAAPDTHAFYLGLMKAAGEEGRSGLGLARIAAEAGMSLSCRESADLFFIVARPSHAPAGRVTTP